MLDEYFSLTLTNDGRLESLPLLLKGYTPVLDRIPHFLLCLGTRVDWTVEKTCFDNVLRELAYFYSPRSLFDSPDNDTNDDDDDDDDAIGAISSAGERPESSEEKHQKWQIQHVLWPSMRRYTSWSRDSLTNGDLKQIANLPDLFRIFERC